jgi:hypothetical protein
MTQFHFPDDFFGDRFTLGALPLPRQASGYAVQMLDTDRLLDEDSGEFLTMRTPALQGLFVSFAAAHAAASRWVNQHGTTPEEHRLAIVPASFDAELKRHVLIYGVLCGQP